MEGVDGSLKITFCERLKFMIPKWFKITTKSSQIHCDSHREQAPALPPPNRLIDKSKDLLLSVST